MCKEGSKVAGLRMLHQVKVVLDTERKSQLADRNVEYDEKLVEIQQNEEHKGDSITVFSVGLHNVAVAKMTLIEGGSPLATESNY